jgi:hypothetical protein
MTLPSTKTPKPNIAKGKRIVGATRSGKPVTAATIARPSRAERIARIHRNAQSSLIEIQRNKRKR